MRQPNNTHETNDHHPRNDRGRGGKGKTGEKRPPPEETEAAQLRARYMGPEMNQSTFSAKKKRQRTTEKKFNFEWDPDEDTSQAYEALYGQKAEPTFF